MPFNCERHKPIQMSNQVPLNISSALSHHHIPPERRGLSQTVTDIRGQLWSVPQLLKCLDDARMWQVAGKSALPFLISSVNILSPFHLNHVN